MAMPPRFRIITWIEVSIPSRITFFGLFAVIAMLLCYALENRSRWFILAFAAACLLASVYGFLQWAWPFGVVEFIWSIVAMRRWSSARSSSRSDGC